MTASSGEERGDAERYAYTEPCDWCGHVDDFFGHAPCRLALSEDREAKDAALTAERHRWEAAERALKEIMRDWAGSGPAAIARSALAPPQEEGE